MNRYGNDFRRGRSPAGHGGAGYDMQFGNWGARSGLDSRPGGRGGPGGAFGGWSGGASPARPAGSRYDTAGGYGRYGGQRQFGGSRGEGTFRGRSGYDAGYRYRAGGTQGRYDRDLARGYDRGYGGGFGMAALHEQMMGGRGEGFGYAGDYHRTHPIRPEEVSGGRGPAGAPGRFGGSRWRGW